MINQVFIPVWLSCVKKGHVEIEDSSENEFKVIHCKLRHECHGCDPSGYSFKKYLLDLEEIEEISSMNIRAEGNLAGYFFTEKGIQKLISKYTESKEKFVFEHRIICDLDAIVIYKVK